MPETTVGQAIETAISLHQAGKFAEAEQIYRKVIGRLPRHAGALHLLGVLAGQTGRANLSIDLIQQAIAINPGNENFHINLGNALAAAGRAEEAIASYLAAIKINPSNGQGYFNLGTALDKQQRSAEAIDAFRKSIALNPDFFDAYKFLGMLLTNAGSHDQAIAAFENAVRLKPQDAEAHNNLGAALLERGHNERAIEALQKAIAIRNDRYQFFSNLGSALHKANQIEPAVQAWQRAIALDPNAGETYSDLCMGLYELDRLDEAESAAETSIRLMPRSAEAFGNRAALLLARGHFDAALKQFEFALGLDPDNARLHVHHAIVQLLLGDFEHGLAEYEWRWKLPPAAVNFRQWRGEPLEGKGILLHAEQGFGDTIQFVRYAPLLAARGARVMLSCQPALMRLFRKMKGIDQIVSAADPAPASDERCTLLSLPLALGTRVESIPSSQKYLDADPQMAQSWKRKLAGATQYRVGLTWAGSPGFKNDRRRSMRLDQLAPLSTIKDVDFFSLQQGAAAIAASPFAHLVYPEGLVDFAETAALIANLDLVISVDTAVAHLAGAMGKPVWLLLPFIPDWRWLLNRDDTPWYASMRLFRQKTPGDWAGVIQQVAESLSAVVGSATSRPEAHPIAASQQSPGSDPDQSV